MAGPDLDETHRGIAERLRRAGCVFADEEARLIVEAGLPAAKREDIVARRVAGEPLEHLLGWVRFCGLAISVDHGVFVPRQRTEFLVRQAAALAPADPVVLDLCCGTGAIAVALGALLGQCDLHAADIDPVAVRCARRNLDQVGGRVYQGDLFDPVPPHLRGRVDILTANVPYVPTDELSTMPAEARGYEPARTHDGGTDGLDMLRRVADGACEWLVPGGHVLVEINRGQTEPALEALTNAGLDAEVATSTEYEATLVIGTAPSLRDSEHPVASRP